LKEVWRKLFSKSSLQVFFFCLCKNLTGHYCSRTAYQELNCDIAKFFGFTFCLYGGAPFLQKREEEVLSAYKREVMQRLTKFFQRAFFKLSDTFPTYPKLLTYLA